MRQFKEEMWTRPVGLKKKRVRILNTELYTVTVSVLCGEMKKKNMFEIALIKTYILLFTYDALLQQSTTAC